MIDWKQIQTVLLDMDGTLLDLHFDNHFWLEFVPLRYAQKHGLTLGEAKARLMSWYRKIEGSLNWYCIDYWSEALGLDIALLKREVDHLISVHPHVPEFLDALRMSGRRAVIVTNAHQKSLALKMERTRLADRFDRIVCAHDLGLPKEDTRFWDVLQGVEPFSADQTLLVDDSQAVLESARRYGVKYLLAVYQPDTRREPKEAGDFQAIRSFRELLPIGQ